MITLLSVCSIIAGSLVKADGWWVWICLCCMMLSRSDRPANRSRLVLFSVPDNAVCKYAVWC